jgi:DNA polymerase III subunit delta
VSSANDQELQRSLRADGSGGVFYFHGEDAHSREEGVARVVDAYSDVGTRDFNLDQLRGADVSAEALASILATPPMMAEWRVVVVREMQGLSVKAREVVEGVLADPPVGLVLVLSGVVPAGSKAKFYTELQRRARSVEFGAVSPHDAPGWLIERAREHHGVQLTADAARGMVSGIGPDLGILAAELAKVVSFCGDRTTITGEDVLAVGGTLPQQDRWLWFDLVGERRFGEALATVPLLLQAGESAVALVIGMTSQLLRIGLVCAGGQAALERELKPYQRWLARRVVPQARRWTAAEIDRALGELLRTDRLLKSASLNDRQALEELILRLAAIPAGAAAAASRR